MVRADWDRLWQQLELGTHESQVLVTPKGSEVTDSPWLLRQASPSTDSAPGWVAPRGPGSPQGGGGPECHAHLPSGGLKVAPSLAEDGAAPIM